MKRRKLMAGLGLAASLVLGMTGCGGAQEAKQSGDTGAKAETRKEDQVYKIGVASYSDSDDEVLMFKDYYQKYLETSFPVEFVYSEPINDAEDEKEFVDTAKEEGCQGIISFITYGISDIVDYCGEDMYYMMGSGTLSEDDFNSVKEKENFLGIIGPSIENESAAGSNMIQSLAGENGSEKTYVILSGGSAVGNFMHRERTLAMLNVLETEEGFTLEKTAEELADASQPVLAATSEDGGKVYLNPGYLDADTYKAGMDAIGADMEVDVVASSYYISPFLEEIAAKETSQNKDIQTGAVDCFCETNRLAFENKDQFGNSQINYIEGKCAAMAAPSFVAMYNAVSGYPDTVRNQGQAFWLNQNFWSADSSDSYLKQSAAAENVYDNVYTTKDIMEVLSEYTDGADFASFEKFIDSIEG